MVDWCSKCEALATDPGPRTHIGTMGNTMGNTPRIEHHIMYAVSDLIYLFALKTKKSID